MKKSIWQSIPIAHGLAEFAAEWDELNRRFFGGHPMFDSRFVDCLLKYFGNGSERLLRLNQDAETAGLCLLRPNRLGIWNSFFPSQAQVAPVFVAADENLAGIFQALPGLANQIDFLGQDPDYSAVRDTLTQPRHSAAHATTISIKVDGDFEDYWNGRSKNLVKNIRRYKNRITQVGANSSFVRIDSPVEIVEAVGRYGRLESASWKGRAGTAVSPDNVQGLFYGEMMAKFAESGNASVYEFWIDGRLAASRLVILGERMLVILKTAYDESLSDYAPGRLLLYDVIQDAFTRIHGGTIEFYTNATQDQMAWATHHRVISHQTVFRSEAQSLLRQLIKSSKHLLSGVKAPEQPMLIESFAGNETSNLAEHAELFAESEKVAFDLGLPWFRNLASTVALDERTARLYVGSIDGKPRAILPVCVPADGNRSRGEALGNYYTTLYQPILSPEASMEDLGLVIAGIAQDFPTLAEMRFAPLDPEAGAAIALRNALQSAGWVTFNYFCFGNWYLPVTSSWQNYLESLNGETRSTIRRMSKKFAANRGRLEIVTGEDGIDEAIAVFQRVYAASWKKFEPYPNFIRGLIQMLVETGRLRLGIAWLDDEPIASQLWIVNHGKASIYKLAFDERFAAYSPGTLLTAHLMKYVIDQDKVREVDYLSGDDPYKQAWMTHRRERWGIVAYDPKKLVGLARFSKECAGRTAKWAARSIRGRTAGNVHDSTGAQGAK